MLWNLRLRFARWLLEPLYVEQEKKLLQALRELQTAQAGLVSSVTAILTDSGERHTIQ